MGEGKRKRDRSRDLLLKQHPTCCFCGGERAASTEDHQPARIFFHRRQWPEGFSFPACEDCNAASRSHEQLAALIARVYPDCPDEDGEREMTRLLDGVSNNFPGLLPNMLLSANAVRRILRERRLELAPGLTTRDVPILSLEDPRIHEAVQIVALKLGLALHYKLTGTIVPRSGGVATMWFSNMNALDGKLPPSLQHLPAVRDLKRATVNLSDQFGYRFGMTDDGQATMFACEFRQSFMTVTAINMNGAKLRALGIPDVRSPLGPWPRVQTGPGQPVTLPALV